MGLLFIVCATLAGLVPEPSAAQQPAPGHYVYSRAPLRENRFIELPLGSIHPEGWLREMLVRQKEGATGNLDKLYPRVMNKRNGWLGGDGDQWERGPYWLDGLLPLAYILHDSELIAKTKPWIEFAINSQTPDGYFGPSKDYGPEAGLQRDNSHDWWPKMVMLKVLKQYYSATRDERVINLLTNYFKYQLKQLPLHPLDHWSFWARYRAGDNLMVVYWLYNITGDKFLLDLADLLHGQTFDYTEAFLNTPLLSETGSIHGVNLAQGMKEPIIYYQQHPDEKYIAATKKAYADLRKYDEMAHGLYGADEALHGNNPTQGSELCTAVEMMFTLESMMEVTGEVNFADRLEKIAFNALPAQAGSDYLSRQYFQQANQVMLTRHTRNFDVDHNGTDLCYGLLTGYACCTSNMHQGWPKFTQNLWYATADHGLAALIYSPNSMKAFVGGDTLISFHEETNYPFDESIRFTFTSEHKSASVQFPFYLRIPEWCTLASVKVNGTFLRDAKGGQVIRIDRKWKNDDRLELVLPMHIFSNTWYENAVSIERGPLTYALRIVENSRKVKNVKDPVAYGASYDEVRPTSPWNYGLIEFDESKMDERFKLERKGTVAAYPWDLHNAPLLIKARARRIDSWKLYNDMAGPLPYSISYQEGAAKQPEVEITLVPYGCTRLRISEFPVVGK